MSTRPLDLPVYISTPIVDNTSAQIYDMIYVHILAEFTDYVYFHAVSHAHICPSCMWL